MLSFENKEKYTFEDYVLLMKLLRSPEGCPWDRVQTHESIRDNLIEEAYETAHAIDSGDKENLCEELGDLLMQVLFHTGIEEDAGSFNIDDVCTSSCRKLLFRHPHVFGDVKAETPDAVLDTWDAVKRLEKHQDTVTTAMSDVAENLPSLWRAKKIQKKAAAGGMDALSADEASANAEMNLQTIMNTEDASVKEKYLGKLLFNVVALSRAIGIDPENALHSECERFISSFSEVENLALSEGKDLAECKAELKKKCHDNG